MRGYLLTARTAKAMTQRDVAGALGVSRQSYQSIESGRRQHDLNSSMVKKFADIFGLSPTEILDAESAYQESRNAVLAQQGLASE